jgi:ATP-dependent Clp protease ATP-binding subunit ClpC
VDIPVDIRRYPSTWIFVGPAGGTFQYHLHIPLRLQFGQMVEVPNPFENFSQPALRLVFWARREAGRSGADAIEPEHLLLGLLREDRGDSGQRTASYISIDGKRVGDGASPSEPFFSSEVAGKLRDSLSESRPRGVPKPEATDMPLSATSIRSLEVAHERAGNSAVRPLHVLWGLATDRDNAVSELLNLNGITVEQIEDAIQR